MRKTAIDHIFDMAKKDDYLEIITSMYKPFTLKKNSLSYDYIENCIRITDHSRKEHYIIQLECINAIKLIKPKFKGLTWYDGMKKRKVGA